MGKQIHAEFRQERETKNTYRFEEVPADASKPDELLIGTIYVPKSTLRAIGNGSIPEQLTVVLS